MGTEFLYGISTEIEKYKDWLILNLRYSLQAL